MRDFMRKALIALAVSSTVISGSVIAADWVTGGTGGSVEIGGTLTISPKLTPWEIKVGAAVHNLDATIKSAGNTVSVPVNTTIPVLSIRTNVHEHVSLWGVSPQISYGNFNPASDMSEAGLGMLTVDVTNEEGNQIGKVKLPLTVAALGGGSTMHSAGLMAPKAGDVFWGGVATTQNMSLAYGDALAKLTAIDPETIINFMDGPSVEQDSVGYITPGNDGTTYSAAYVSGIESGKNLVITFNDAVKSGSITWKASLPITVSYV
ncbi:TPA: hypothetical protein HGR80_21440 [Escherichia coli]|nr:hypothetical protein [Escherichia coli]